MKRRDGYPVRIEGQYELITVLGKDLYIQPKGSIDYVYAPEGRSIPAFFFSKKEGGWSLLWDDGSGETKPLESYPSLSAAVLGMKGYEESWFEDHKP